MYNIYKSELDIGLSRTTISYKTITNSTLLVINFALLPRCFHTRTQQSQGFRQFIMYTKNKCLGDIITKLKPSVFHRRLYLINIGTYIGFCFGVYIISIVHSYYEVLQNNEQEYWVLQSVIFFLCFKWNRRNKQIFKQWLITVIKLTVTVGYIINVFA